MTKDERQKWEEIGFQFSCGVWRCAGIFVLVFVVLSLFWGFVSTYTGVGHDNSDPAYGNSQMSVRIDALTGCQYLAAASLTPRLDAAGKQICGAKQ